MWSMKFTVSARYMLQFPFGDGGAVVLCETPQTVNLSAHQDGGHSGNNGQRSNF
jgi:hypothetical protein